MQTAQVEVGHPMEHDTDDVDALIERCRQQEPGWRFAVEYVGHNAAVLAFDERGVFIGKV